MWRQIVITMSCGLAMAPAAMSGQIDTQAGAFDPEVATMQSRVNGNNNNLPVILLGGNETLQFSFDILKPERDYLRYTLMHCDADWQPSKITAGEYAAGFNEWAIDDYAYSQSTSVPYTHYVITLEDADSKPMLSGNYLLRVFKEEDPDEIIAQFRFLVTEQSAMIFASASSDTDIDFNKSHQQVSATINVAQSRVRDPYNDLILKVSQNGRIDNESKIEHPSRMINSTTAVYQHQSQLIFEAGNEYRRFETVSAYVPAMGVASVNYHDPYYHYTLFVDTPRDEQMYIYDRTLRGGFVVRNETVADSDSEADYGIVHFSLDYPYVADGAIYLDADFDNRRLDESSRMAYNPHTELYERSVMLKQGAYSYQYLFVASNDKCGTTAAIEGNHYQANNRYRLVVYARNSLDRYDRVIGVAEIDTQND